MIQILNAEPADYSHRARDVLLSLGALEERDCATRAQLMDALLGKSVLIVRFRHLIDREVLESSDCLKVIVSPTTGLDHLDLETARELGIEVLSLRGERRFLETIPATAELTWSLLLALVRRLPEAQLQVANRSFDRYQARGRELAGKNLGILGLGRVGSQVAKYGDAFGMEVGAFDPLSKADIPSVRSFSSIESLAEWCHILSVHLALTPDTAGILDINVLKRLRPHAWLINTARGELLDETALLRLLRTGHIAGAALDVLRDEVALKNQPDRKLLRYADENPTLILTPHIGGATVESMERTEVFMAEKLRTFLTSG